MTAIAQDTSQGNRKCQRSDGEEVVISEWPLNSRETARVTLVLYKGTWLVNLRKWFEGEDGEMRPGKGLAIGVKHLPAIVSATTEAKSIARERGLIRDGNSAHP